MFRERHLQRLWQGINLWNAPGAFFQAEAAKMSEANTKKPSRRDFNRGLMRGAGLLAIVGVTAGMGRRMRKDNTVWQLDPDKCVQCGRCATECVLNPSAVKCVHAYDICGYCDLCAGYHQPSAKVTDTAAENQLCPTAAIKRTYIEDPYYEYAIEESLCVGCGKCVKGCGAFGNGSLFLQVRHDRCVNCNDCSIARACPANAFRRVSAEQPYILKGQSGEARA